MIKEQIDKIMEYKSIKSKQKIDRLLELNANQYTNTGTDSTKAEMNIAENTSRYIYRKIKQLDSKLGDMLLRT